VGHLAATRLAPGGPEVEKHGTTRVIRQAGRAAGERFQREFGRGRSNRWGKSRPAAGRSVANAMQRKRETNRTLVPPKANPRIPGWGARPGPRFLQPGHCKHV